MDNSEEETSSDDDDDDDDDDEETDSDDETETETETETDDEMDVDELEVEVTVESLYAAMDALIRSRGPWEPACVRAMHSIGIDYEQGSLAQIEALIALLYEKRNGVELSFELCVALLVYEAATTDFQQELGARLLARANNCADVLPPKATLPTGGRGCSCLVCVLRAVFLRLSYLKQF